MAYLPSLSPLRTAVSLAVCGWALSALASTASDATTNQQSLPPLEEVTIIGDRQASREIAGSGALIDSLQIRDELATDINQLLKTVPAPTFGRKMVTACDQHRYSRCDC